MCSYYGLRILDRFVCSLHSRTWMVGPTFDLSISAEKTASSSGSYFLIAAMHSAVDFCLKTISLTLTVLRTVSEKLGIPNRLWKLSSGRVEVSRDLFEDPFQLFDHSLPEKKQTSCIPLDSWVVCWREMYASARKPFDVQCPHHSAWLQ